jgi:hypothetical protein
VRRTDLALRLPVIGFRLAALESLMRLLQTGSAYAVLCGPERRASRRSTGRSFLAACRVVAAVRAPTGADLAEPLHVGSFAA